MDNLFFKPSSAFIRPSSERSGLPSSIGHWSEATPSIANH
jgi:hypothetical protein